MRGKKMTAALLSAALLCNGGAVFAFAADASAGAAADHTVDQPTAAVEEQTPEYAADFAAVEEVTLTEDGKNDSILVKTEGENGQTIQLNVGDETVFLDTTAGIPVGKETIKKGDRIYAYYSTAMTRSIPPQSYAYAVLVNLDESHVPAHLLTAEEVTKNDDGSVTVLCSKGGMLVTIAQDTPISPLYTKNIVRNTDIEVGTRFFAWYDIVALSMPGQANALKVVLLPASDNGGSGENSDEAADDRFTDVKTGDWYYDSVIYCADNGLMSGTGTAVFSPDMVTSREMIATVLWHVAGSPKVEYSMTYKDVPAGSGYADAIRWASKEGIVSGYNDETFGMGKPITREELAVMLYHYAQKQGKGFTGEWMFLLDAKDADKVSEWADEAMHWCVMEKIISGNASGMLSPQGQATRAETAAMLQHFSEAMK